MDPDVAPAADSGGDDATDPNHWRRLFYVAVAILCAFLVLAVVMIILAADGDAAWQRRIYIFGSVQAIVFTAVGWLFGREVHRSAAEVAVQQLRDARRETEQARSETARYAAVAAELQAKTVAIRAAASSPSGYGPEAGAETSGGRGPAVDLRGFINDLLGP